MPVFFSNDAEFRRQHPYPTRNPASQILTESSTNGVFAWNAHPSGTTTANYTANGLNQYTDVSGNGFCHDANGNLTADATYAYLYDNE
ncbi:hypothetical protein, partial [Aurantiacibacter sp. D1-12]|uniref:hypothetical protein n=1 Tax=Aurantiacibacter sp. D1-12 TaxID=2993658 RepID=UPI00406CA16F|nr:hypothetical protein [Aurantiacibacter sp. D1-12]